MLVVAVVLGRMMPAEALERSEQRTACNDHNPLGNVYFGDTHVHTSFSFDANALGVRNTPRDAYRFARGAELGLQPYNNDGTPGRTVKLSRPLDFAIVTDHAGLLGETYICANPEQSGHDSLVCKICRRWPLLSYYLVNSRAFSSTDPRRYSFCGADGQICKSAATVPWKAIQDAAEQAYDRSSECSFTTFVGYEWSAGPEGYMLHRNVIFRNAIVPSSPTSYLDQQTPAGLWDKLHQDCLDLDNGCDVLAIPHNSNLSGGRIFATEIGREGRVDAAAVRKRAALEPLIEIMQHKGDSECQPGPFNQDELCSFEKLPYSLIRRHSLPYQWETPPPASFVRNALGQGLAIEQQIGINPFKLGIIASTDTHLGTPGLVDEQGYPGHAAGGDTTRVAIPAMPDAIEFNPGGLAALWAEENSRDALFEAMQRREAYGTSGPRIVVRFFGGWDYAPDICASSSFAADGYAAGVPMGGDLQPSPTNTASSVSPQFAVWALKDPGTAERPGTDLERIQIVKVWLQDGKPQQRVYDVVSRPQPDESLDTTTCMSKNSGAGSLCTLWRDPQFAVDQPSLYYARVIESPSCRWSTFVCNDKGVDCSDPDSVPVALASCCQESVPKTIRERAWTSPIWYTPPSSSP